MRRALPRSAVRPLTAALTVALTVALTAVVVVLAVAVAPRAAYAEGTDPPWAACSQYLVPVTLSATDPTGYHVSGRLCTQDAVERSRRVVQVLVSGMTYDHNYFNSGYQPYLYSYVYTATGRGYATFNIDRLGVGQSDRPPAELLTVQNQAYVLGQVIQQLRAGAIGSHGFTTVVAVGHSLGAGIVQHLAGAYADRSMTPDYLILSGWLHQGAPAASGLFGASLYDAAADPLFASAGLPVGYQTTRPDTRGTLFYDRWNSDPSVIAQDEQTKQTGTAAERITLIADRTSGITLDITVPVLLSVGQNDVLLCDPAAGLPCDTAANLVAREAAHFGPRACLAAYVVVGTGHSVNLQYKAPESYNYHHNWLENYTTNYANSRDANGCAPVP